jgi:hypothetical protein
VVVVVVDLVVLEELKRCEIRRNLNRNKTAFFAVVGSEKKMKNGKWWYIQHVPAILIFILFLLFGFDYWASPSWIMCCSLLFAPGFLIHNFFLHFLSLYVYSPLDKAA